MVHHSEQTPLVNFKSSHKNRTIKSNASNKLQCIFVFYECTKIVFTIIIIIIIIIIIAIIIIILFIIVKTNFREATSTYYCCLQMKLFNNTVISEN